MLKANLIKIYVLEEGADKTCLVNGAGNTLTCATTNLTFEQQKEILMFQLKHDEMMQKAETDKQLKVETLCFETEQAKLPLEPHRLELIKNGTLISD